MKTIIETPNFKARQELLDFVQEKTDKLDLYSDRIIESRVYLKLNNSDNGENKVCEIKVLIPGNDLFASAESTSFEEAVVKAIEGVKHQIERWKDSKNRKSHSTPL
ncbi:HPF/RaiA family ribosome-associated protein [Fulvivirga ulvae]|uniref:HPF/RaiA family ribosome-associated protein n=1 Tax=Fulvivirga ulvae TaxID=2904245 RepID=UPI001F3F65A9|nr:HPF/RaiA family ribosome-associated protein [Fulvivirga ulvae]UII30654.1 HPF/RaiA family ribosome-associated protein [Fulvivirga ulvae]